MCLENFFVFLYFLGSVDAQHAFWSVDFSVKHSDHELLVGCCSRFNHLFSCCHEHKIVSFEELAERRAQLPEPVVMTNGVFDILHRGHVTYLAQARELGKSLIVAVNSDTSVKMLGKGDDRPINTEADRAAVLASLEAVDLVVIFKEKVPLKVIEEAHPDIYVKGGDYRIEDLPEASLVASWGGRTVTVEFEHQRSTTALLKKVRGA